MFTGEELQKILIQAQLDHGVPGAQLVVYANGEQFSCEAGVLSTETDEKVREQSLFQIGSITKIMTATVIMILRDQGKLQLDSLIRDFLPSFRTADLEASKTVTIKHLLNHTSGLDGDMHSDTGNGDDKLERLIERYALLDQLYPVGDRLSYCNAGYNILGRIIEVITGLTYERALDTFIFEPLNLKNSYCNPLDIVGKPAASGHSPAQDGANAQVPVKSLYIIPISSAPAGMVMMSAADLLTFTQMHLNDGVAKDGTRILSKASVEEMRQETIKIQRPMRGIDRWGLGWFLCSVEGGEFYGHDGGTIGQSAYLRVHQETGTILILLTNGGAANDCSNQVFEKVLYPLTETKEIKPSINPVELPGELGKYTGTYKNVGGDTVIAVQDGKLVRRAHNRIDDWIIEHPEAELTYIGDDTFIFYPPSAAAPTTLSFFDVDAAGVPQTIFSGLRVFKRVL